MAHPGTAHTYSKKLIAFEHVSSASSSTTNEATNTLLWIGGLGDGLLTVQYPAQIAASLPPDWRLAEVLIKSSYNGWATGSLGRDARELGQCVAYFKELRKEGSVVLMGHSTGCQDIMEYLIGADAHERPMIEGAILQGGVSDREAWADMLKTDEEKKQLEEIVAAAKRMIDDGDEKSILQMEDNVVAKELGAPISAYRTYSLLAKGGDDDYFSTDLSDEHFCTTFGEIPKATKVCFLLGGEDPYVPASIDRAALLQRWTRIIRECGGSVDNTNGGVVPGATHNLNGDPDEVVQDLVKRVVGFVENVETLEKSESGNAARL
jgi:pimeloyl-ACP methyl ester carboxylesterase